MIDPSVCDYCGGESYHHTTECFVGDTHDAEVIETMLARFTGAYVSKAELIAYAAELRGEN